MLLSVVSAVISTGGLSPIGQTPPSCTHSGGEEKQSNSQAPSRPVAGRSASSSAIP